MKKLFIICIDENISQPIGDEIESIWLSKRKAEKRKKELENGGYDEDRILYEAHKRFGNVVKVLITNNPGLYTR